MEAKLDRLESAENAIKEMLNMGGKLYFEEHFFDVIMRNMVPIINASQTTDELLTDDIMRYLFEICPQYWKNCKFRFEGLNDMYQLHYFVVKGLIHASCRLVIDTFRYFNEYQTTSGYFTGFRDRKETELGQHVLLEPEIIEMDLNDDWRDVEDLMEVSQMSTTRSEVPNSLTIPQSSLNQHKFDELAELVENSTEINVEWKWMFEELIKINEEKKKELEKLQKMF